MARPRVHDDRLRERLLAAAGRTVGEHGIEALTLRGVAAAEGTSTTAIYSLFGGRSELISALFLAAYGSFGDAQRAVPRTSDAIADLHALGVAYRRWGLAEPHLYAVMFGGALGDVEISDGEWAQCGATMDPLRDAVARGLAGGPLAGGSVETIAHSFWAIVHGLVSLELAAPSDLDEAARSALFDAAVAAMIRGWSAVGQIAAPMADLG